MSKNKEGTTLNLKVGEIFYYLFWCTMLFAKGTGLYDGMKQYNICLILAIIFLIIKVLLTNYRIIEILWVIPLVLFGLWIYLHSKDQSALILIGVIIGIKDVKVTRIFKIGLLIWGSCFIYLILRTLMGGYPGPILAHEKLGLGPILRWSLGYTHPNVLHITYVIFGAFILYIWNLKEDKKQWGISVALMFGNIYIFLYSVSFTGFVFMTLLLILNLCLSGRKKICKTEIWLLKCIFPFCIIFSVIGPMILDGDGWLFQLITRALNNRYSATKIYIRELGISFWGIEVPALHGYAVDCSYTEALLSYGVIFFMIMVIVYILAINDIIKNHQWTELAIMLSLLIAGVSEPFLFNTSFKNLTVIFVGHYIYECSERWGNKHVSSLLGKNVLLFSKWNIILDFPFIRIKNLYYRLCNILAKNRAKVILIITVTGVLFMILGYCFITLPDSIYIGIGSTDCAAQEMKFIDMKNLSDDFNSLIYEYPGPDKGMYEFSGNMLLVEYIRKIVSAGVWGGISCSVLFLLFKMFVFKLNIKEKL